ncbi:MAG: ECF transporter S component [Candidatus Izemoplasmatales bacterium]|nr:ECF transporter S component [Candidatus Izemoplasmatales bacterium]MDD5292963.1 ECF transporter S component [Candidatus Izemoplasmatales bacterium]
MSDTTIYIITLIAMVFAVGLLWLLAHFSKKAGTTNRRSIVMGVVMLAFIISGISFALATMDNDVTFMEISADDARSGKIKPDGTLTAKFPLETDGSAKTVTLEVAGVDYYQSTLTLGDGIGATTYVVTLALEDENYTFSSVYYVGDTLTEYQESGSFTRTHYGSFKNILMVNSVILAVYVLILLVSFLIHKKQKQIRGLSTRKLAFLGILIGLSSALMLLSVPIMPAAPFLKVELSGLVIFMTLLWFDFKTAAIVSLITNFIHVFMPGSAPLILFLDEGVNFIATMVFLLPMAIMIRMIDFEHRKNNWKFIVVSVLGVIFTVIVMTLYNAYVNLPIIYKMTMPFKTVAEIFGVFNLIKWGLVAIAINLTWRRLFSLRHFGESEAMIED